MGTHRGQEMTTYLKGSEGIHLILKGYKGYIYKAYNANSRYHKRIQPRT